MQKAKELLVYHSKEAGYASISLLGNIGVIFSDVFILAAGINLLTKPSVLMNPEVLVACVVAGLTSKYAGSVSNWATEKNRELWINHLNEVELKGGEI
jgi:hypothetical protein